MQISINWINELVDLELTQIETIKNKLTLGGFEVENSFDIEINQTKETILDITATANRSDSLSTYGLTNEISVLFDKPLKSSVFNKLNQKWNEKIFAHSTETLLNKNCSTFLTVVVENLNTIIIPRWMKQKLQSSGIILSNTISDFQAYILLETGYPFEFYDLDKICDKVNQKNFNLSIKPLLKNYEFIINNNFKYDLQNSILTVNANEIPISIAGTVVEKNFIPSKTTKNLLIEASIFSAATIRQQSRKLGLRTDRSSRYEKSIRNTYLINSLYRLISLLRIENPKLICKIHTFNKIDETDLKPILLNYLTVQEILGPVKNLNICIEKTLIDEYLKRLNFTFTYNVLDSTWLINIPHSRADDITREIDIIEEIGRLYGFDNFSTDLPSIPKIGKKDSNYKIRTKITTCFLNLGFTEFMNYSLENKSKIHTNSIQIINPLINDYSTLRSSLLPNLVQRVAENVNQKNLAIEGFEYGHVFHSNKFKSFQENEYVSGIFGGFKTKLFWKTKEFAINWFEAKGKIEIFLKQFNFEIVWKKPSNMLDYPFFHLSRFAELYTKTNQLLGVFGQINPIIAKKFNISSELYLFEFNLQTIESYSKNNKLSVSKEYSLYPKIIKNLSFLIRTDIEFEAVQNLLYLNGTDLLSKVNLIDQFNGPSIDKNYTSLCFELIFQSNEKTLETKKIEEILRNLKLILIQKFNTIIRD